MNPSEKGAPGEMAAFGGERGARRPPRKFNPHPFAYHQELELEITSLTNMGQGVGRVDGWVVFVPFVIPGERVRVRIYRNDKNFSEADLIEVLHASPERVAPQCALFGACGGCQYQHLAYESQLEWKRRQVAELLRHMARIETTVEPVIASPKRYGYRSKITPHFEKPANGQAGEIGFLRHGMRRQLIDVPRCEIATDAINEKLGGVRAAVRANPARYKRGATLLLRDSRGRVLTDSQDLADEEVCGLRFHFLAGEFFQNNPFILDAFVSHAIDEAKRCGAANLLDAYCGCGLFSLAGAKHFQRVLGVEVSGAAVARAQANALGNGIANASFIAGRAEAIFDAVDFAGADAAVIIDPPRAGCDQVFLGQLFAFAPRRVVYVSCNPATQMRDLREFLDKGYAIERVQPFDLFPQTKHLECVITLVAKAPAGCATAR